MPSSLGRKFDRIVKWVNSHILKEGKIYIRTVENLKLNKNKVWGYAHIKSRRKCFIYICKGIELHAAVDTLLHEVAHFIEYQKTGKFYYHDHSLQHGREWGIIYSDVYRRYHKWLDKQIDENVKKNGEAG